MKNAKFEEWDGKEVSLDIRDKWAAEIVNDDDSNEGFSYIFSGDSLVVKLTSADGSFTLFDCKVRRRMYVGAPKEES